MGWLAEIVQGTVDLPLAIDSADPNAVRKGLELARAKPIVNSITLEAERLESFLPLISEFECMVIALLMSDAGPPTGVEDRLKTTESLIGKLTAAGKKPDEIIIDPGFFPIATDVNAACHAFKTIAEIRQRFPEVHVGGGVSNASHGLPNRRYVNLAAIVQGVFAGMDCAIVDPCVEGTVGLIHAAETLAGRDEFCMNYVTAAREGKLH
jgi:5-methyltetrahydrofolate--homocysteine methyltransferase